MRKREVNNSEGWHYPIKRYSVTVKTKSNGFVTKSNSCEDNQQNTVGFFFFFQTFKRNPKSKEEQKIFVFIWVFIFARFIHESECFDEWINTTKKELNKKVILNKTLKFDPLHQCLDKIDNRKRQMDSRKWNDIIKSQNLYRRSVNIFFVMFPN